LLNDRTPPFDFRSCIVGLIFNITQELMMKEQFSMQGKEDKFFGLKKEQLVEMYRQMVLIRRFEEKAAQMYGMGKIGGFCHLYIGEEAIAVGAMAALREGDYVLSAYRDHGHALTKGMDPSKVMAELFGKVTGSSHGKGGSMHLFDAAKHFLGGYAIVAGHVPIATGVAFAARYRGEDKVTLCLFGEGATNQGVFHEALNLAALWKLPIVYLCENNRYGMGTSVERASAVWDVYEKACAYDMPRGLVDGMDVLAVYRSVTDAVKRAREHHIPTLLEARTYRFRGHSMSDPIHGHYRTKEEVEQQKARDPILLFGNMLKEERVVTDAGIEEIEKSVKAVIDASVKFAEESSEPPLESIREDVYI
jgi:pyruvate dehydrogenase E1 component alpha subunit